MKTYPSSEDDMLYEIDEAIQELASEMAAKFAQSIDALVAAMSEFDRAAFAHPVQQFWFTVK